jgi:hypothetical protein
MRVQMEGMAFMERTVPTAQKASRLHRSGSNAGVKVIHKRIHRLLSTMAAGGEYDKEEEKKLPRLESYDRFSRAPDKYSRMANVLESHTSC